MHRNRFNPCQIPIRPSPPAKIEANSAKKAEMVPPGLRHFDDLPDSAYVRLPVVLMLRACSPATVWRAVKDGRLPKPKKLSPGITAWNVGELRRAAKTESDHD